MVDNYDSFTYNLVHLLEELGAEVLVRQSDAITPEEAVALAPDRLVVSPARDAQRAPAARSSSSSLSGRRPPRSASASDTRRSSRRSAARSGRRERSCTARRANSATTAGGSSPGFRRRSTSGRYHSLAAVRVPDDARSDRTDERRRGDGCPPSPPSDRRRPVPPGERAHARWTADAPQLPRGS